MPMSRTGWMITGQPGPYLHARTLSVGLMTQRLRQEMQHLLHKMLFVDNAAAPLAYQCLEDATRQPSPLLHAMTELVACKPAGNTSSQFMERIHATHTCTEVCIPDTYMMHGRAKGKAFGLACHSLCISLHYPSRQRLHPMSA